MEQRSGGFSEHAVIFTVCGSAAGGLFCALPAIYPKIPRDKEKNRLVAHGHSSG